MSEGGARTDNIADVYPLSPTQKGILFESLYAADSGVYVEQITWELRGELNVAAYRRAWDEIVQRHAILRTALVWESVEQPLQVVRKQVRSPWEEIDWRGESRNTQEAKFAELLASDQTRGFELSRAPLLRLTLVHVADDAYRFLWSFHHVILDGWSEPLLLREVLSTYEAVCRHRDAPLPASPPYRDFIAWLGQQDRAAAETFWRSHLAGFIKPTPLPLEALASQREAEGGFSDIERIVNPEISRKMQTFVRAQQITLSTLVHAAWGLVISIYSGDRDVIFGNVVAGRPPGLSGGDRIIGLMVNTLPARVSINTTQPVGEWLRDLQERESATREYEHVALMDVQGWSELPRGTALFESVVAVENLQSSVPPMLDGLMEVRHIRRHPSRASYPLVLGIVPGNALSVGIGYKRSRFDATAVETILDHFLFALEALTADARRCVGELPNMPPDQRQRVVNDWNATQVLFPTDQNVHDLFSRQAHRKPDAAAIIDGDSAVSFRELERRSNHVSRCLTRQGVRSGDTVGLLFERSTDWLVAILGVLKAGATYVPLDPANPPARLTSIIRDADVKRVISNCNQGGLMEPGAGTLHIHDLLASDREDVDESLSNAASSRQGLAYILYTSGSTGVPKGVAVSHRALANHCHAAARRYELNDSDRVLQFASIGFDVAAEEVYPTWASGAAVVLRPPGLPPDIGEFLQFVEHHHITVLNLPSAYWQGWVRAMQESSVAVPACVRLVIVGNERVPTAALHEWNRRVTGVRWMNAYGPTEATITATVYEPDAISLSSVGDTVPIGRPLANVKAYVLDPEHRPLPVGATGELYLGGAGIADGYFNEPELTVARFLPNPFEVVAGETLYRTGDRARWRSDGNLEFLGRLDDQIKLRGFRIEPGEIESTLLQHSAVREATVIARPDHTGQFRLIAYVVPGERAPIELWPSVGEYPIYDELLYFAMTSDQPRTRAFRAAIEQLVPGRTVVEIGTGADAVLARFCAEAGATRVYAIEASTGACEAAKRRIAELGLEDRIIVLPGDSMRTELPELVDVCVSEIIGTIASSEGAAAILNDARRFLNTDGIMIPQRCMTRIAAVSLPDAAWLGAGFSMLSAPYVSRVYRAAGGRFDLRICLKHVDSSCVISDTATFEELDFTRPVHTAHQREITLTVRRRGLLTGVLLWINLQTCEGETVDSLLQQTSWLPVYFPLFQHCALTVEAGDTIHAACTSQLSNNAINPDYRLQGVLHRTRAEPIRFDYASKHHGGDFGQNEFYRTWLAEPLPVRDVSALKASDLRSYLEQRLPAYMVPTSIVIVQALPRSASGKIDRLALPVPDDALTNRSRECRQPSNAVEQTLLDICQQVLNLPDISLEDNFFQVGGDSILALQLVSRARRAALHITLEQIFRSASLAALAAAAMPLGNTPAKLEVVSGPAPLTPIQAWFFEQEFTEAHHYNQAIRLDCDVRLTVDLVDAALQAVVAHHAVLRLRFSQIDSRWSQQVGSSIQRIPLDSLDLGGMDDQTRERVIAQETAERQSGLNLQRGPLVRSIIFSNGPGRSPQLVIVIHHLVIDAVSWRILLEDLDRACRQVLRCEPVELPAATSPYQTWARRLEQEAGALTIRREVDYWRVLGAMETPGLPLDHACGANLEMAADTVSMCLETDQTDALLRGVNLAYHTRVNDLLLTAMVQVITSWTGSDIAWLDLEGHGREPLFDDLDLTRTVGWFTSVFPICLRLPRLSRPGDAIKSIKEQLAAVPGRVAYGLLRYLSPDPGVRALMRSVPKPLIAFNYFGQVDADLAPDALLWPSPHLIGANRSPQQARSHILEINAMVRGGQLQIGWTYATEIHRRTTIETLASQYLDALRALVRHCRSAGEAGYTPSDFPLAGVDQKQLDRLIGSFRRSARRPQL